MDENLLRALERMAEGLNAQAEALSSTAERTRELDVEFGEFGQTLDRNAIVARRREEAINSYTEKIKADALEREKKQAEAVKNTIVGLTNFSKSLTSSPGSFAPLNAVIDITTKTLGSLASAIPVVGGALKGLAEGAGEVLKMVTDSFQRAYENFEKLSDTGVVEKFEDLRVGGETLGLTFADMSNVLGKASKDLAAFGGSAIAGRKEFERVGLESTEVRRTFQRLGIGAAEFNEFQISYIAQQQRYSRGQTKSAKDLAEGSSTYIKELDALAKLTGASRKILQQEQEARLRDVRYRAGIASLPETTRKEIDKMLGVLKQVAPGVEEGMKDLIASGGVPVTEAGKAAMLALEQGGLNVQQVIADMRSGNVKGIEAFQKIASAAGKAADKTELLARIQGDNTALTKVFVDLRELEARGMKITSKEYEDLQKEQGRVQQGMYNQNTALADAKTAMYNTARNVELLATTSDFATKAIELMANGIEYVTEKMYEMAGKGLPEHLKARKEERQAIEEYTKAAAKAEDKIITSVDSVTGERTEMLLSKEEQLSGFKLAMDQAAKKRQEAEKAAGIGPKPSEVRAKEAAKKEAEKTPEQRALETEIAKASEEFKLHHQIFLKEKADKDKIGIELLEKQNELEKETDKEKKELIRQNIERLKLEKNEKEKEGSILKTAQAQAVALEKKKIKAEEDLARLKIDEDAKRATKILTDRKNETAQTPTPAGKPVSEEELRGAVPKAAIGGIFDGPKSGYPVELHGKEAVVPLNMGKKIENLNLASNNTSRILVEEQNEDLEKFGKTITSSELNLKKFTTSIIKLNEFNQKDLDVKEELESVNTDLTEAMEGAFVNLSNFTDQLKVVFTRLPPPASAGTPVRAASGGSAMSGAGATGAPAQAGGGGEKSIAYSGKSGSKQNFDSLNEGFRTKIITAAEEYNSTTGKKIQINSARRSTEDQVRLYQETVNAGRPGIGPNGMPVGKPGRSTHEQGTAVDIQNYNDPAAVSAMNRQGLFQTVPRDPVHFEAPKAALGGILQGPTSGFNAVLHGREMVIPLNSNSILEKLASTPSTATEPNIAAAGQADNREVVQALLNMADRMDDKFDSMISLLSSGNKYTRNIAQNLV